MSTINGDETSETIVGTSDRDIISGKGGLNGGAGNNSLAAAGGDVLYAGTGLDTLSGGTSADQFIFPTDSKTCYEEVITDFQDGVDHIKADLDNIWLDETSEGTTVCFGNHTQPPPPSLPKSFSDRSCFLSTAKKSTAAVSDQSCFSMCRKARSRRAISYPSDRHCMLAGSGSV